MKSIEERAFDFAMDEVKVEGFDFGSVKDGYIQGAYDQKAIDDKEKEELINLASKRIADVEASRSRLLQRREHIQEHIVERACKEFCCSCMRENDRSCICLDNSKCRLYKDFRKGLEE